MTKDEAIRIGFPLEWLPTSLTVNEALTETCDDCKRVMKKHDSAKWRLQIRPIRCEDCINKLVKKGFDRWEATYTD